MWSGIGGKSRDCILNNSNLSDWFNHLTHPKTLLKKKLSIPCWFVVGF